MRYKIEYISTFYTDIASVMEVLEEYPSKASRIFSRLDKSIGNLGTMPEMYPIYQYVPSYRFITIEDYLVFYKFKKQENLVELRRLLPGKMDISEFLQE